MALDSQTHPAGAIPAASDLSGDGRNAAPQDVSARAATTASMQNLLAHYFETQHYGATQAAAPSAAPVEVRPLTAAEQIAHLGSRVEAAFVNIPAHTVNSSPAATESWPISAQALIESLMAENERLRGDVRKLAEAARAAEAQADSDVLTPTLNRRAFVREMQRAMADCRRYGEQACLIYLDMDGFKGINDTYGHAAGDAALVYVAQTLTGSVREGDSVGRIGGDEFAILLRRADLNSSRIKALKLEAELALGTFEYDGLYLKTGGSFGVRPYAAQDSAETWLSEADAAMFLVKKSSR